MYKDYIVCPVCGGHMIVTNDEMPSWCDTCGCGMKNAQLVFDGSDLEKDDLLSTTELLIELVNKTKIHEHAAYKYGVLVDPYLL
jgi:transcription initiation factor TFIIIB Brf1 subunit/transcription initiation factor TFIIB